MNFESFSFAPEILKAINDCGYKTLTPIQRKAIPAVRRGHDVLASAQTGTGKTAAFSLPMLQKMIEQPRPLASSHVRALILTPTRELAEQIANNIKQYSSYMKLTVRLMTGGKNADNQAKQLRQGTDILVATPGRLMEQLKDCNLSLSQVDYLVLDEADRMLDMGFIKDIQKVMQVCNKRRQTLMFSATFSGGVRTLADQLMPKHVVISADQYNTTAKTVSQVVYPVEQRRKIELLSELIGRKNWHQVLVFSATREDCERLTKELNDNGIATGVIHSEKAHGSRRRALKQFTEGKLRVLVSTEVAARGLDIQNLEYVVNYDMPFKPEDYVHRIGRTGRAGKSGVAVSFVARDEERMLSDIEKLIGQRIKRITVPGYEVNRRESLLKNLQRRRFSKKLREDEAIAQVSAEKNIGSRVKIKVGSTGSKKKIK